MIAFPICWHVSRYYLEIIWLWTLIERICVSVSRGSSSAICWQPDTILFAELWQVCKLFQWPNRSRIIRFWSAYGFLSLDRVFFFAHVLPVPARHFSMLFMVFNFLRTVVACALKVSMRLKTRSSGCWWNMKQ